MNSNVNEPKIQHHHFEHEKQTFNKHIEHNKHKIHKEHNHSHHIKDFKKRLIISLILTIPILLLSEMIQMWFRFKIVLPYQRFILLALSIVIYIYGGLPFLKGLIDEIKRKSPGMMTLIGMAITAAFIYSAFIVFNGRTGDFFWELATLIDIMLFGHLLEARSVLGASRALEELAKIMPKEAHLIKNNEIIDIPLSELKIGDLVLVRPGEKIPSDGIVIEGESFINESLLTGEAKPVHKKKSDSVIGGAINGDSNLRVKIKKTGEDTYVSQVIKLVQDAKKSRSKTQDLTDRAAALLFYIALITSIITFTFWIFLQSIDFALLRAITVLVIACPHALGLAIPLVVSISTSITSRKGILVRSREVFEYLKNINAVAFDKTGTLTKGIFGVSEIVSFINEEELLKYTISLEINSSHIIAKVLSEYAKERNIEILKVYDFKEIPGKGVLGNINGKKIVVGNTTLMEELGIDYKEEKRINELMRTGKTIVFVGIDKKLSGVIALSDEIKKESYEAIKSLKEKNIKVFMLTGDNEKVSEWVAKELNIDKYFAQLLPQEKSKKIKELKDSGFKIAFVGDGINDAPSLSISDAGIAIGAGTDVAIESADIILVKNNPNDVNTIINLSKITYRKMVQNLWWAAGYNIVAIPLAAGILYKAQIILSPATGAILMSLSTVIVAINASTLFRLLHK